MSYPLAWGGGSSADLCGDSPDLARLCSQLRASAGGVNPLNLPTGLWGSMMLVGPESSLGLRMAKVPLVLLSVPVALWNKWNCIPMRRKLQVHNKDVEIKEANGKYMWLHVTWPYFIFFLLDRSGYTFFQIHFIYWKVQICVNKKIFSNLMSNLANSFDNKKWQSQQRNRATVDFSK